MNEVKSIVDRGEISIIKGIAAKADKGKKA